MASQNLLQTLVLKDVPPEEISLMTKKYEMMGAKIERTKQHDGKYTVRITVETLPE
jgi:hypothetical protein